MTRATDLLWRRWARWPVTRRWVGLGALLGVLATAVLGGAAIIAVRVGCFEFMEDCAPSPAILGFIAAGAASTMAVGALADWRVKDRGFRTAVYSMLATAVGSVLAFVLMTAPFFGESGSETAEALVLGGPEFVAFYLAVGVFGLFVFRWLRRIVFWLPAPLTDGASRCVDIVRGRFGGS